MPGGVGFEHRVTPAGARNAQEYRDTPAVSPAEAARASCTVRGNSLARDGERRLRVDAQHRVHAHGVRAGHRAISRDVDQPEDVVAGRDLELDGSRWLAAPVPATVVVVACRFVHGDYEASRFVPVVGAVTRTTGRAVQVTGKVISVALPGLVVTRTGLAPLHRAFDATSVSCTAYVPAGTANRVTPPDSTHCCVHGLRGQSPTPTRKPASASGPVAGTLTRIVVIAMQVTANVISVRASATTVTVRGFGMPTEQFGATQVRAMT